MSYKIISGSSTEQETAITTEVATTITVKHQSDNISLITTVARVMVSPTSASGALTVALGATKNLPKPHPIILQAAASSIS